MLQNFVHLYYFPLQLQVTMSTVCLHALKLEFNRYTNMVIHFVLYMAPFH